MVKMNSPRPIYLGGVASTSHIVDETTARELEASGFAKRERPATDAEIAAVQAAKSSVEHEPLESPRKEAVKDAASAQAGLTSSTISARPVAAKKTRRA